MTDATPEISFHATLRLRQRRIDRAVEKFLAGKAR
jgi:hypothetical protein